MRTKILLSVCLLFTSCHTCDLLSVPGLIVEFAPPCENISASIKDGEYMKQLGATSIECQLSGAFDRPGTYVLTTNRGEVINVVVHANECHPETVTVKAK